MKGNNKNFTALTNTSSIHVLTSATIKALNNKNNFIKCRALLDTCSTVNLITEDLAKSLGLPLEKCNLPIGALNSLYTFTKYSVVIKFRSIYNDFEKTLRFMTVPKIADSIPSEVIPREHLSIPANVRLADPNFHLPAPIDMIISSGPTISLFCLGQYDLGNKVTDLFLRKTRLGWVLAGDVNIDYKPNFERCNIITSSIGNNANNLLIDLNENLRRFWEIEDIEIPKSIIFRSEELECKRHFDEHTKRTFDGRFEVALPFKANKSDIGESRKQATRQIFTLKRRLDKNPELKKEYTEVINEYLQLGQMYEIEDVSDDGYYMPHHPVLKETSTTTKVRVVFNASAKSSTGVSLNDTLMVGPTIQDTTFIHHLKFRLNEIAITADIEKMYRQIVIRPEDRKYQRILWLSGDTIKTLESKVLMFGEASAPFIAIYTMQKLAESEQEKYPLGAKILKENLYVDDVIAGANTISEAINIRDQITKILKSGGFNIRQWASNYKEVLTGLDERKVNSKLDLSKDCALKTLGVYWNAKKDVYNYSVKAFNIPNRITKRYIVSEIAKIYDPLGFLGPVILYAKIIIQQLWLSKVDWDETVPEYIYTKWVNFCNELTMINSWSFDRKVLCTNLQKIQLYGFSDACENGYGATIYLKSINQHETKCKLYCAKSRVAPTKRLSTPRLELRAAELLVKLYEEIINSIGIEINECYFWTDSTIVIHWILSSSHTLKTFVGNRVAYIQNKTKIEQWFHVKSEENPADALSRGQTPLEFMKNSSWLEGPKWLKLDQNQWPKSIIEPIKEIPETKKNLYFLVNPEVNIADEFKRYSCYVKLLRVMSICFRWLKGSKFKGKLTAEEVRATKKRIIKQFQLSFFVDEIKSLKSNNTLKKCRLISLNPFIDSDGILRVGGRLKKSQKLTYDQQHPILLPSHNFVTDLIIRHYHLLNYHAGIQLTLHTLRQRFWILDGRNQIRKIVRSCVTCFRVNPPEAKYLMGNLPTCRINQAEPF